MSVSSGEALVSTMTGEQHDLVAMHRDDSKQLTIVQYLENGTPPYDKKTATKIILEHSHLELVDGVLYYIGPFPG